MSTNEIRNRYALSSERINETDEFHNESNNESNRHSQNDRQNLPGSNRSLSNRFNFYDEGLIYLSNLSNFNWRLIMTPLLNLFNYNTNQQISRYNQSNNQHPLTARNFINDRNFDNSSVQQQRTSESIFRSTSTFGNNSHLSENMTETDSIDVNIDLDINFNIDQNTVFISRSHLIRVIFFKITAFYAISFSYKMRKIIEYTLLASAILSFLILIYLHSLFIHSPINCLKDVNKTWNGEGILRVKILDEQAETSIEQNSETRDLKEFVVEYSLEHGYLRLSPEARSKLNISIMTVTLNPNQDACFGDELSRFILKYFLGYNDILLNSLKGLAENQSSKGFIKNLVTGEYFRFVNIWMTRMSYVVAAFIMVLFTLTISMLIRYSHHQILILTMQIFNMLQPNSAVNIPFAQICTVILALIGIEAIMSEFFNDTQTALNVILIVWAADVFDWVCCNTIITKRNWLKFFYLYHFAFYAYAYRFNGQYSNLALLSSGLFTAHSMVYFLHNYEIPYILSLLSLN